MCRQGKRTQYLLNVNHDEGRGKALFYMLVGFSSEQWEQLAQALINHVNENEIAREETTHFGTRYVVEGILKTPVGRDVQLRSVWFISKGTSIPRLVTAYPREEIGD